MGNFGWRGNGSITPPPTAAADPRLQQRQEPICLCTNVNPSVAATLAPLLFHTGLWSAQERHEPPAAPASTECYVGKPTNYQPHSRFHFYPIIPPVMYVVNSGVKARVVADSSAVSPEANVLVCLTFLVFRFC